MLLYVRSRGVNIDYAWHQLLENDEEIVVPFPGPSVYRDIYQLIRTWMPTRTGTLLHSSGSELVLLVAGVPSGGRRDFIGRPLRNELLAVRTFDEDGPGRVAFCRLASTGLLTLERLLLAHVRNDDQLGFRSSGLWRGLFGADEEEFHGEHPHGAAPGRHGKGQYDCVCNFPVQKRVGPVAVVTDVPPIESIEGLRVTTRVPLWSASEF
jgi:hypothetical protein